MMKAHQDFNETIKTCRRLQIPCIYSTPSKTHPGMVEVAYDLHTVYFRGDSGGICGIFLTGEARRDLEIYIENLKKQGLSDAGNIRYPDCPRNVFPEYDDAGFVRVLESEELNVAREFDRILRNPFNWVLDGWVDHMPEIREQLEVKRRLWKWQTTYRNPEDAKFS